MTDAIHAEARKRVMRSNPTITAEAFDAWLAVALSRGATIVLQLDGARAEYERVSALAVPFQSSTGVQP